MRTLKMIRWCGFFTIGIALCATSAEATTVQDLVRLKGHERNVLTGMGIVIGLDGTGDSSRDSYVTARPYAELLKNLGNPVLSLEELRKADAYAIVEVSLTVPPTGTREGDRLDVHVAALFNAESLAGGRLIVSPLRLPRPDSSFLEPFAIAEGSISTEGDNPRTGVIHDGGQMLRDIRANPVTSAGTITLVLKDQYAGYPVSSMIAATVNEEFVFDGQPDLAVVEDAKNIRILLPKADRERPATFLARLMTVPIDASMLMTEARIVINRKQGIILVTGNVEIGPVGITHRNLTISSGTPGFLVAPIDSGSEPTEWAAIDTSSGAGASGRSTRLVELLDAFKQLHVPVADQIAIIHELKKTGALHAEIVNE